MTIRLRMTLLYSGILSITLLLFGIVLYVFLKFYIFSDLKKRLRNKLMCFKGMYSISLNYTLWDGIC